MIDSVFDRQMVELVEYYLKIFVQLDFLSKLFVVVVKHWQLLLDLNVYVFHVHDKQLQLLDTKIMASIVQVLGRLLIVDYSILFVVSELNYFQDLDLMVR